MEQQQQHEHNYQSNPSQRQVRDQTEETSLIAHPFDLKINPLNHIYIDSPNNHKKTIIHDINLLDKRFKTINERRESFDKNPVWSEVPENMQKSMSPLIQAFVSSPKENLEMLKVGLKSVRVGNDDYLKHNMNTVKQKIRNKLLKQKVDFADTTPKHSQSEKKEYIQQSLPERERIDKYNHDFEEYLIRKRINNKKKIITQAQDFNFVGTEQFQSDVLHLELDLTSKGGLERFKRGLREKRGRTLHEVHELLNSTDGDESKMIIVSRLNPVQNTMGKFKNVLIETARKSLSKHEEAEFLLKRYVDRHFCKGIKAYQRSSKGKKDFASLSEQRRNAGLESIKMESTINPAKFIKNPLNYTLFKKQISKMRKQSIGLPLLLESQQKEQLNRQQAFLQKKLNSRKIDPFLTIPTESQQEKLMGKNEPKKYVVYSRKNLHSNRVDSLRCEVQEGIVL